MRIRFSIELYEPEEDRYNDAIGHYQETAGFTTARDGRIEEVQ